MKTLSIFKSLFSIIVAITFTATAHASLIGSNATCATNSDFITCAPASSVVVGSGIEFHIGTPSFPPFAETHSVDIGASSVTMSLTYSQSQTFDMGGDLYLIISGLNEAVGIASVISTGITGNDFSNISFNSGVLTMFIGGPAFNGTLWHTGSSVVVNFFTNSESVPEPQTYALFLVGLCLMYFISRRRNA